MTKCLARGSPLHSGSWESLPTSSSSFFLASSAPILAMLWEWLRAPSTRLSVTWGDPEMMTPDEPWMCGNLTTMPKEPGSRGGRHPGLMQFLWSHCWAELAAHPVCVSCSQNAVCTVRVVVHSEMDLSGVALLMRYIVMSAQAEGAKQNDC